jgi:hypothetical protein
MTEGARAWPQDDEPPQPPQPPLGSLADEAVKLADAAQLWLRARSATGGPGGAGGSADPWAAATDHVGTPAECRTCPICRAKRFARSLDPEVLGHLSDAVGSLGRAVAAFSRNRQTGGR